MAYNIWPGYTPYEQLMRTLAATNPVAGKAFYDAPVTFRPARAAVPYTNTPQRASSTFVRNIRYTPATNSVMVKLGNNNYWYNMSPRMLSLWLTSDSLGRFYNKHVKL